MVVVQLTLLYAFLSGFSTESIIQSSVPRRVHNIVVDCKYYIFQCTHYRFLHRSVNKKDKYMSAHSF